MQTGGQTGGQTDGYFGQIFLSAGGIYRFGQRMAETAGAPELVRRQMKRGALLSPRQFLHGC